MFLLFNLASITHVLEWGTRCEVSLCACRCAPGHFSFLRLLFRSIAWTLRWSHQQTKSLCPVTLIKAGLCYEGSERLLSAWHWVRSKAEGWAAGGCSQLWLLAIEPGLPLRCSALLEGSASSTPSQKGGWAEVRATSGKLSITVWSWINRCHAGKPLKSPQLPNFSHPQWCFSLGFQGFVLVPRESFKKHISRSVRLLAPIDFNET